MPAWRSCQIRRHIPLVCRSWHIRFFSVAFNFSERSAVHIRWQIDVIMNMKVAFVGSFVVI